MRPTPCPPSQVGPTWPSPLPGLGPFVSRPTWQDDTGRGCWLLPRGQGWRAVGPLGGAGRA